MVCLHPFSFRRSRMKWWTTGPICWPMRIGCSSHFSQVCFCGSISYSSLWLNWSSHSITLVLIQPCIRWLLFTHYWQCLTTQVMIGSTQFIIHPTVRNPRSSSHKSTTSARQRCFRRVADVRRSMPRPTAIPGAKAVHSGGKVVLEGDGAPEMVKPWWDNWYRLGQIEVRPRVFPSVVAAILHSLGIPKVVYGQAGSCQLSMSSNCQNPRLANDY